MFDVTVVGSGPNGLAAGIAAARSGLSVRVIEAADDFGGGVRSAETIETGYLNDLCSAVHPMAYESPFFRWFDLADKVSFHVPEMSYAHVISPGRSAVAYRDLSRTVEGLGADGSRWRRLFQPLAHNARRQTDAVMNAPLAASPREMVSLMRIGVRAAFLNGGLHGFAGEDAPALIAGLAAHAMHGTTSVASASIGLQLGTLAHAGGWPIPHGGSQAITNALIHDLRKHGAVLESGRRVTTLAELSDSRVVLLDVTPKAFTELVGDALNSRASDRYNSFRYGPGIAKVDYTLDGPVPWTDDRLHDAGTVHIGGTARELARSEAGILAGTPQQHPFVMVSQASRFDPTRAPAGKHTLWAYAHVPAGSGLDMTDVITQTIERNAPGFTDLIRAKRHQSARDTETHNANFVGGDIGAGATNLQQILGRPRISRTPWRTPIPGVYLCSASTSPGPGVHGMCGWLAARTALRDQFGLDLPKLT
jgi:phytoene dehydrogenase-like protein